MELLIKLYWVWCITLFIVGYCVYYINPKDRLPKFSSDIYDRLWWKYSKQVIWYLLFWAADLPWILPSSPLRKLFKKDH